MKRIAILLICAHLAGCAIVTAEKWPDAGSGGFGEWMPAVEEVERLQDRLESLRARGAATRTAAAFEAAETLMTRVRREYAAGLDIDGESDFRDLLRLLALIEQRVGEGPRGGRRS